MNPSDTPLITLTLPEPAAAALLAAVNRALVQARAGGARIQVRFGQPAHPEPGLPALCLDGGAFEVTLTGVAAPAGELFLAVRPRAGHARETTLDRQELSRWRERAAALAAARTRLASLGPRCELAAQQLLFGFLVQGCWLEELLGFPPRSAAAILEILAQTFGMGSITGLWLARTIACDPLLAWLEIFRQVQVPSAAARNPRRLTFLVGSLRHGGSDRVMALLAGGLAGRGYEVFLVTREPDHPEDYPLPAAVTRLVLATQGSRRHAQLGELIQAHQLGLFVVTDCGSEVAMRDLAYLKGHGLRVVMMEHGSYFGLIYVNTLRSFSLRKWIYPKVDALTCLSRTDLSLWRATGLKRVLFMPNPLPFEVEAVQVAPLAAPEILFAGRIALGKGVEQALQAFARVLKSVPDAHLTILGKADKPASLARAEALAAALGIRDRVDFAGHQRQVEAYWSKAAVHVFPSWTEGSPMVLAEAKAFGVPTVMFRMDYLELAGEGTVAVEPGDCEALAAEMVRLLRDPEARNLMGREARASLDPCRRDRVLDRWSRLLEAVTADVIDDPLFAEDGRPSDAGLLQCALEEVHKSIQHHLVHDLGSGAGPAELVLPMAQALARGHRQVVVCGAGAVALEATRIADVLGLEIRCFTDRDPALQGGFLGRVAVVSLDEGLALGLPCVVATVAFGQEVAREIRERARALEIPEPAVFLASPGQP